MTHQLNPGQEAAAEQIVDYLSGKIDKPYFTLSGGPGTGKTFMIKEAISRAKISIERTSAAAIAHAAKNVLKDSLHKDLACFTVAQWLGMKMQYDDLGNTVFKQDKFAAKYLTAYKVGILDEASMIHDELYYQILSIIEELGIKLIVVGDVFQLPPVGQDHDSKFFDNIDAMLTQPMRFTGPISTLSEVYKSAIQELNKGFIGDLYALNNATNREGVWDHTLNSGYKFKNNIHEVIEQIADEISHNKDNLSYSRMLAFKNETVTTLNNGIRDVIYGKHINQFERDEIVISNGGFTLNKRPIIYNGEIKRIAGAVPIIGPYEVPCLSLKFQGFTPIDNVVIPVVETTPAGLRKYGAIKQRLYNQAVADKRQWPIYHGFINSFAYFDYAYALSSHKAQGQTLKNVYVMEGEIMSVKPLTLKQKYQALYVAMTRATNALYIYNKNY